MCLWILTACLGLLPGNPSTAPIIVMPGVPSPILQPTTEATTTTTTTTVVPPSSNPLNVTGPPPGNMTGLPPGNMTGPPPGNMTGPPPANITGPPTGNMTGPPPGNMTGPPPVNMTGPAPSNITGPPPGNMTGPPPGNMTRPPPTGSNITGTPPASNTPPQGPPMIDPRLGTTPATSSAYQLPPINGNGASIPSYDTAVKFPREKRSVSLFNEVNNDNDLINLIKSSKERRHIVNKRQSCSCVPAGTCPNYSGGGMIDIRIVGLTQCPSGQVYCCAGSNGGDGGNNNGQTIQCGIRQAVPSTVISPGSGQTNFGEYPWQAIVLTKQNDYIAGGVLVDQRNVLTVTHRLVPYVVSGTAPNVKVRLGEWDAAGTYEPVPYQEYTVQKVFTHPSYVASTLQYDITVLRLSTMVPITPALGAATTINRACLPPSSAITYVGQRCWVSGWGKDMFGVQGQYQQILKKVDVPIVDSSTCQTQLRTARLGPNYMLDTTSFICAGGEANKDSCTGDGGSGLVCQMGGQWIVVGLVSWGLGCANPNVPAAYVNIAALLPWIQQQLAAP